VLVDFFWYVSHSFLSSSVIDADEISGPRDIPLERRGGFIETIQRFSGACSWIIPFNRRAGVRECLQ
jgi:hypothetical protein